MKKFIFCFYAFTLSVGVCAEQSVVPIKKIKLYAIFSPSHEQYFNEWFLPSIKDDYELVIRKHEQLCSSGEYHSRNWSLITLKKIDLMIEAIKENWGGVFVYSDVDIQFFKPTWPIINRELKNYDMVIQSVYPNKYFPCTGFFACRGNERTLRTWQAAKDFILNKRSATEIDDQDAFIEIMKKNPFNLKLGYLSNAFKAGERVKIPADEIIMHHAIWVVGKEKKLAQLAKVKEHVEQGKPV